MKKILESVPRQVWEKDVLAIQWKGTKLVAILSPVNIADDVSM